MLVCLAYLVVSPYFERLNNPNENVRVWATRAIVEHHVLNIDEVEREWGYVNDKAKNDRHVYSGKAPGVSFLGVPVLFVHTEAAAPRRAGRRPASARRPSGCACSRSSCRCACSSGCFARYVERVTRSGLARDLLVVALGLGTLLYPYGGLFVGHALAAAAAFSAFILLDDAARRPPAQQAKQDARRIRLRLAAAGSAGGG